MPPRMSENDRDNINTPPAGLTVWCNNCGSNGEMQVYNGTEWTNMIGGAAALPPQVGDFMEGGVVFYIFQNGDPGYVAGETHGLVCAIQDQSTGTQWGCSGTSISTSTSLGTGNQNTITIMSGCSTAGIAARLCGDLVLNGYSDWYLPSKDELNLMYQNKATIDATASANGGSGFAITFYWSSTEFNNDNAWIQYFDSGFQNYNLKYLSNSVRAVRAF
ncbi:MAG: DUF1566 domain-containing protein [Psychroflexus maritimus]